MTIVDAKKHMAYILVNEDEDDDLIIVDEEMTKETYKKWTQRVWMYIPDLDILEAHNLLRHATLNQVGDQEKKTITKAVFEAEWVG